MEKNLILIHNRNILLLKIIITCFVLDIIINFVFDRSILLIIIPATMLIISLISILIYFKVWIRETAYIMILSIYLPFIMLIETEPLIINYIFIWAPFIVSSLYQRALPVIISSCTVNFLTVFYYYKFMDIIFADLYPEDIIYIILFNLFLTIIILFSGRYIENELWSKNAYLSSFFNNTSDAIVVYNLTGSIIRVNESFEKLTGYEESEVINLKLKIIEEQYLDEFKKTVNGIKKTKCSKTIETVIKCKNGSIRYLILTITPVKSRVNRVTSYICLGKDITKQKLTEEALRRTEMLSVVGQLAAGIAHEIKNPLTVLSGFVQLMKQQDEGHSHQNYYEIMQSELNRILLITNEFLVLGKQHSVSFVDKRIQLLVREVVFFLKAEAEKNNVNLQMTIQDNIPTVSCNPNQLKQVFINIIKNGIEAMPDGGNLNVEVGLDENNGVAIKVADEGCGMTKEMLVKIGTPFYTTKEDGTGLGMMVCQQIIESHHGKIKIESEVNSGTKIKIWLPIKENQTAIVQ